MQPISLNYLYGVMIVATLGGGIGDSFQPARVLAIIIGLMAFFLVRRTDAPTPVSRQALFMASTFVFFGVVSLSWSPDILGGTGLVLAVTLGGLAILAASRMDVGVQGIGLLVWAWVVAVSLSMPVAFYEIFTGVHFQFALDGRNLGGTLLTELPFASIFFGNYNDYSTWLCLAFPITMSAFFLARTIHLKVFIVALNISVCIVIFINTSRGCLAYVALVILFYLVKYPAFRLYGAILAAAAFPVIVSLFGDRILDVYSTAVYKFQIASEIDESYIQRSGILFTGLMALLESFGFGVGVGGFEEYINDNNPYLIPNPHNILLEIGVNFGVIALGFFVALVIRLFLISIRSDTICDVFKLPVMLAALAVPILGIVPSQAVGYIYWWVWLGTVIAMASTDTRLVKGLCAPVTDQLVSADRDVVK